MKGLFIVSMVTLSFIGTLAAAEKKFDQADIYMEQNASDNDLEVVIKATGGNVGMVDLKIVAPNGRTVVDIKSDNKMGLRHFDFESPEPKNDGSLKKDFPVGEYTFSGTFMSGEKLSAKSTLNHKLPSVATFVYPINEADNIDSQNLVIKWKTQEIHDNIIITIEEETSGQEVKATLLGNAKSFKVPNGFMMPNTTYKVSIGTIAKNKNGSFVEVEIKTAK